MSQLPTTQPVHREAPADTLAGPDAAPHRPAQAPQVGHVLQALAVAAVLAAGLAWGLEAVVGAGAWVAPLSALAGTLAALWPSPWSPFRRAASPAEGEAGPQAIGLARPFFLDLAQREWSRARRYGSGTAVVLVEIDRHARLCEARGPHAAEAVLAELLRLTGATLRPADVLTRYADAQMAVLLAHADATGALDVAERIRERAEQMDVVIASADAPPQRVRITVSCGVAHLRPAHQSLQDLLDDMEDALHSARQAGGNCVRAAPVDGQGRRASGRSDRRAQPRPGAGY